MEYTFVRSNRRTIGITIEKDGSIVLRAPIFCSKKRAEEFLYSKQDWIRRTQKKMERQRLLSEAEADDQIVPFTKEELDELGKRARKILIPMTEEIAEYMGVKYGRIAIRTQRSRWGSCSSKGNLNFNRLLVLLPENVQRYVVVHELCHLKEMNHSKRFWAEVAKYQPTYKADRKQLKELESALLSRIPH